MMLEDGQAQRAGKPKAIPLLVAAALAAAVGTVAYLAWKERSERLPEPVVLTDAARAYLPMLDLGGVEMSAKENALGQTLVEITGTIRNAGDRHVRGIRINCVFFDVHGIELHRVLSTVVRSDRGLAPASEREFRLPFDDIPEGWNQVMPNLYIAEIAFD